MASTGLNLFDLQEGKHLFGRYRIDAALAHGPLSARFAVYDEEAQQALNLELFTAGLFEGHGQASFFADRLRAFSQVACAVAVPTHTIQVTEAGDVLRFCERADGTSLRSMLQAGQLLTRARAVALGEELLSGLMALHNHGMAHGDLKPDTLYLQENGVVAVEGGVTPALWRAQHMGARTSLIGTPFYAPLEQFSGEVPDAGSDLYAIGTLLYEGLCGALPWAGKGFIEVFQSKMQDNPPPIESRAPNLRVGKGLEEVLRRSIRARREDRYLHAADFLRALQSVATESVS